MFQIRQVGHLMLVQKSFDKKGVLPSMAKYTEKADKKADVKMVKGLTPKQKVAFKKADEAHKKVKTMAADKALDKKILAKVKKSK